MFKAYCDYKLENLSKELLPRLSRQRPDPFDEDVVLCQSRALEAYVKKQLADKNGIAANVSFPYPRTAIFDLLNDADIPGVSFRYSSETMVWRIYAALPEIWNDYPPLKEYVENHPLSRDVRLYKLANEIASVFDYYVGYRGDWLEKWSNGESIKKSWQGTPLDLGPAEKWQSELWRRVTGAPDNKFHRVQTLLRDNRGKIEKAAQDISIFGLSNMPPDYLEFFKLLGEMVDVEFHYLMPSVEYWAETTRKTALLESTGNPLLASFGALGRDFLATMMDLFPDDISGVLEFPEVLDSEVDSVLDALQLDILLDKSADESALKKWKEKTPDNSVEIACCHSRIREAETLKDHILELLDSEIKAEDILVTAPRISDYAPYLQAVLEPSSDSDPIIPFHIANTSLLETSEEAGVFLKILGLAESAFKATEVFDIVSSPPVAGRFGFSREDISSMRELIASANIAWGKDADHQKELLDFDYPDTCTWHAGLRRIIAGFAFDAPGMTDCDVAPLPLDSDQIAAAGALADIADKLFNTAKKIRPSKTPEKWRETLNAVIADFLRKADDTNKKLNPITAAVESLVNAWQDAELAETEIPSAVVVAALKDALGTDERRGVLGFTRGAVTICDLSAARAVPFKAVCVLGMNDGEFPRRDSKKGFDLSLLDPRPGDRSPRKSDNYLFLEAIMACRERLWISYTGHSETDNKEKPPSPLLSELIDYLAAATEKEEKKEKKKGSEFVTEHKLHGFDAAYFTGEDNFNISYSQAQLEAAKAFLDDTSSSNQYVFCPKPLPLEDEVIEASFKEFVRFFRSPTKSFLNTRLKINLYKENEPQLLELEPFDINNLERYTFRQEALDNALHDRPFDFPRTKCAEGAFPPGLWGEETAEEYDALADEIAKVAKLFGAPAPVAETVSIEFDINGKILRLSGRFEDIRGEHMVFTRTGEISDKYLLAPWIWRLLAIEHGLKLRDPVYMIGVEKGDIQIQSLDLDENAPPPDEKAEEDDTPVRKTSLRDLAKIFLKGLERPLPLFDISSQVFAEQAIKSKLMEDDDNAARAAAKRWTEGKHSNDPSCDLQEKANLICFGAEPPHLDDRFAREFRELSLDIYGPVILNKRKETIESVEKHLEISNA